ncbi:hypothetical protein V6Z11_A02G068200 [Gossypium hirsutum]
MKVEVFGCLEGFEFEELKRVVNLLKLRVKAK